MSITILPLRRLGAGGNADVYLARRSDTGEQVVIKFLREYHLPHARKAFIREVRVLARCHRGLVPVLFSDLKAERPYYVMPYLGGGCLTPYAGRLNDAQLQAIALAV